MVYSPRSSQTTDKRFQQLEPRFQYYGQQLKLLGVTKQLLWEEYLKEQPDGYRYAQFSFHLKHYLSAQPQATMAQSHVPGERLEIVFAGKPLQYFDRESHEWVSCPVLVFTLPFSSMNHGTAVHLSFCAHAFAAYDPCIWRLDTRQRQAFPAP